MLLLDSRIGSAELKPYFKPYDVDVELSTLEFGDVYFIGNGPDGPEMIGVERKVVTDLISSMRSKRLSGHQLPGLIKTYSRVYLLIEGTMRTGDDGTLHVWLEGRKRSARAKMSGSWGPLMLGGKPIMYREVQHYLSTLANICGVRVIQTANKYQTAAWIISEYHWWNDKTWDQHRSHIEIYAPVGSASGSGHRGSFLQRTVGFAEKVAAQIPGIDKAAWTIAKKFKTVEGMVSASVEDWAETKIEMQGKNGKLIKRLGDKMAERIFEIWR